MRLQITGLHHDLEADHAFFSANGWVLFDQSWCNLIFFYFHFWFHVMFMICKFIATMSRFIIELRVIFFKVISSFGFPKILSLQYIVLFNFKLFILLSELFVFAFKLIILGYNIFLLFGQFLDNFLVYIICTHELYALIYFQ